MKVAIGFLVFILFLGIIVLPMVGLVWWFIVKVPIEFFQVALGISLCWLAMGGLTLFVLIGIGKIRELWTRNR